MIVYQQQSRAKPGLPSGPTPGFIAQALIEDRRSRYPSFCKPRSNVGLEATAIVARRR